MLQSNLCDNYFQLCRYTIHLESTIFYCKIKCNIVILVMDLLFEGIDCCLPLPYLSCFQLQILQVIYYLSDLIIPFSSNAKQSGNSQCWQKRATRQHFVSLYPLFCQILWLFLTLIFTSFFSKHLKLFFIITIQLGRTTIIGNILFCNDIE